MEVRILHDFKITLMVTPRAGNYTVCNLIRQISPETPFIVGSSNFINNNWERKRWESLTRQDIEIIKTYTNIKFVRNPYLRAISSYYYFCVHKFMSIPDNEIQNMSFGLFLDFFKKSNLFELNNHFSGQFNSADATLNPHIIKMESINENRSKISKLINVNLPDDIFSNDGKCHYKRKVNIGYHVAHLPFKELALLSNPLQAVIDYKWFLTKEVGLEVNLQQGTVAANLKRLFEQELVLRKLTKLSYSWKFSK